MPTIPVLRAGAVLLLLPACGCARQDIPPATAATPESADEFVARVNKDLAALDTEVSGYTEATFITVGSQLLNARATDGYLAESQSKTPEEACEMYEVTVHFFGDAIAILYGSESAYT